MRNSIVDLKPLLHPHHKSKHGKSKPFLWRHRLDPPNGLLDFDKMGKRESFFDGIQGAHESRFESEKASLPPKKVIVPNFKKQTKRDSLLVKDPEILAYVDEPRGERNFGYPSEPPVKKEEKKYQKVLIQGRL